MGKKQWIVALGGLVVVALMYVFGNRVSQAGMAPAVAMATQGASMAKVKAAAFDNILRDAKMNIPRDLATRIAEMENTVSGTSDEAVKVDGYRHLAAVWDSLGQRPISAYYKGMEGKAKSSPSTMTFAANVFLLYQQQSADSSLRKWQIDEAEKLLKNAEEIDPEKDSIQVGLAKVDVAKGDVMEGVRKLKNVTEKDPQNIPANMTLGQLSITSGQYNKAIEQLEIVTSQQPQNVEALYYLAEAYKNNGKKTKAIELFEKTKTLINDPGFTKEIDDYINSFK